MFYYLKDICIVEYPKQNLQESFQVSKYHMLKYGNISL